MIEQRCDVCAKPQDDLGLVGTVSTITVPMPEATMTGCTLSVTVIAQAPYHPLLERVCKRCAATALRRAAEMLQPTFTKNGDA